MEELYLPTTLKEHGRKGSGQRLADLLFAEEEGRPNSGCWVQHGRAGKEEEYTGKIGPNPHHPADAEKKVKDKSVRLKLFGKKSRKKEVPQELPEETHQDTLVSLLGACRLPHLQLITLEKSEEDSLKPKGLPGVSR